MITGVVIAKLLSTVALVMGLTWVAERVDTRFAGILSGMPLGALMVLIFVGNELGSDFAATSALYAIPSLAGTLVFAGVYYLLSRTDHPASPVAATIGAFICQLGAAYGLSQITFTLLGGLIFITFVIALSIRLFKHIPEERVAKRVRLTIWHLCFRAGLAAISVLSITSLSEAVGPLWAGLLIGFPITFLPFLLVIHVTYSRQHAHTVIRNFPAGLGGVICYLATVNVYAVDLGINAAILLGVLASLVYLAGVSYVLRNRNRKQSV
jgi:uncharacterized membrane protein (GlpM family)